MNCSNSFFFLFLKNNAYMQLVCGCGYVIMCVVLIVVLLICGCIYLYINFSNKQNAYMLVVRVCVWGWGGVVRWVCK